jgi:hypothetical protein
VETATGNADARINGHETPLLSSMLAPMPQLEALRYFESAA